MVLLSCFSASTFVVLILLSTFASTVVQAAACNGQIKSIGVGERGGVLYSDEFPKHYDNSDNCGWELSADNGRIVQLETLDIDIEKYGDTCLDYLRAYDAAACNGQIKSINVGERGGVLYSNEFPKHYANSDSCGWELLANDGRIVQLETLDIDIENHGARCLDYLRAYDGPNDTSPYLKTWCGIEKAWVKSTGRYLFLKFVSNPTINRKGFAIAYNQIEPYDESCVEGQTASLSAGMVPVLYHIFVHKRDQYSTRRCQWRFVAQEFERVVLTVVRSEYLSCHDGHLDLRDGSGTYARSILHWCSSFAIPFATFYSSGSALLTLSLNNPYNTEFELVLKVHTRPVQETCDNNSMPQFDLPMYGIVFMAFPYDYNSRGEPCPVFFRRAPGYGYRIDVLNVENRVVSCNSSGVSVHKGHGVDSKPMNPECWRELRPIFLSPLDNLTIAPLPKTSSVLQIIAQDSDCLGVVKTEQVFPKAQSLRIPPNDTDGQSFFHDYCIRRILFSAEEGYPRISFSGRLLDSSGGDLITVYGGDSVLDPVTVKLDLKYSFRDKVVVGKSHETLVEFSSDGFDDEGHVVMTYSKVLTTDICLGEERVLKATSVVKNLTSEGYPGKFSNNFVCRYKITTAIEGHVVHLEVQDQDFDATCGDQLNIFSGDPRDYSSDKLGLVCGGNPSSPTKFESRRSSMYIVFISDNEENYGGGWKLEYFSAPPTPPKEDKKNYTAITLGVVLGLIILGLCIALVYLLNQKSKQDSAAPQV